jgi:hypothetical protein
MAAAVETEVRIEWETQLAEALDKAKADGKHVLLDFFNPG